MFLKAVTCTILFAREQRSWSNGLTRSSVETKVLETKVEVVSTKHSCEIKDRAGRQVTSSPTYKQQQTWNILSLKIIFKYFTGAWGPSGSTRGPAPRLLPRYSRGGRKPPPGHHPEPDGPCGAPAATCGPPKGAEGGRGSGSGSGRSMAPAATTAACGGTEKRGLAMCDTKNKLYSR